MQQPSAYAAGALRYGGSNHNGSSSTGIAAKAPPAPAPVANANAACCSLAADRVALLSALVSASLARAPGGQQQQQHQNDAYHARLLSFAARLLGSGVSSSASASAAPSSSSSSSSSDAAAVVSNLKLRLLAQRRDRDALALDERFARLCALQAAAGAGGRLAARTHGAALQLLAALSPAGATSAVPAAQLPVGSLAAYQPLRLPEMQLPQQLRSGAEAGGAGGGAGSGAVLGGDFMGLSASAQQQQQQMQQQHQRARAIQQQQQQQQQQQARPLTPPAQQTARTTTSTTMSASRLPDALAREASIVRDVLRAAQHVDGAHVTFDLPPSSSSAAPSGRRGPAPPAAGQAENLTGSADPALAALDRGVRVAPYKDTRLHPAQRALVHALGGELGLVVEAVRRHAGHAGGGGGGGSADGGAVRLAFAGALSEELADYYRVLALLEAQARFRPPPPVPAAAAVPGAADEDDDGCGADDHDGNNNTDEDDGCGAFDADDDYSAAASTPYLTLRRLALWLSEPLRRLRALAAAGDACAGAKGAALASRLWALSRAGDPDQRALLGRVLRAACAPLLERARRWVLEGALADDPAGEFFVVRGSGSGGGGGGGLPSSSAPQLDPWRDCYRIEPARVPAFVSSSLARRVLRAGKSLYFLREVCGDGRWARGHARAAAAEALAAAAEGRDEDDDAEGDGGFARELAALERVVDAALRRVDARVMLLLRSPSPSAASAATAAAPEPSPAPIAGFDLPRHLVAARRYLLLGQGDFAAALLDAAAPELAKPAAQVSEAALEHALRQAVACSAARDDDPDTLDRLRARRGRAAAGGGETGWDVFALEYAVWAAGGAGGLGGGGGGGGGGGASAPSSSPLASVFTAEAMASYRRVGRLMWRLRRAERALADVWRALKTEVERGARRLRPGAPARAGVEALLREALSARNDAAALVAAVQHYAAFDVVEVAWARFGQAAGAARDLDALAAAHAAFLAEVERGALLRQQPPPRASSAAAASGAAAPATPLAALEALIDDALALHPIVARLADGVGRAAAWLDDRARRAAAATAAGGWGATAETGGVEDGGGALAPRELEALGIELASLREGREARRGELLARLRAADAAAGGGGQLGALLEALLRAAEGEEGGAGGVGGA
jgi:gamma-tubulin complex component 3